MHAFYHCGGILFGLVVRIGENRQYQQDTQVRVYDSIICVADAVFLTGFPNAGRGQDSKYPVSLVLSVSEWDGSMLDVAAN